MSPETLAQAILEAAKDAALVERVAAATISTDGARAADPEDVAFILAAFAAELMPMGRPRREVGARLVARDPEPCQHEWLSRESLDDEWRLCRLCGARRAALMPWGDHGAR